MGDVEIGNKMMRLDCKHIFCQSCIEGWFADHNTCPNCRHAFSSNSVSKSDLPYLITILNDFFYYLTDIRH